ncbi:MAG TPA: hypothetical protein VLX64_00080 [Thermoplasmata archaeon]|nr:hypothetical protein [Thermoplasmata archaeon]HUJ77381.1 hypothetical protein [Thermoplasmata archaeon]
MRAGIVVIGLVFAILGAVLAFYPVLQTASTTLTPTEPYEAWNVTAGLSITGTIPITVDWSSSTSVTVIAGTCDSVTGSGITSACTNPHNSSETGTSGSFSLTPKSGGAVLVAIEIPTTASVSVTVKEAQTTVGDALLILGVLLFLIGLVMRRRGRARPAPLKPAPTSGPAAPGPEPTEEPTATGMPGPGSGG